MSYFRTKGAEEELLNLEMVAAKFAEAVAFAGKSGVAEDEVKTMADWISDMIGETIGGRINELREELDQQAEISLADWHAELRGDYYARVL